MYAGNLLPMQFPKGLVYRGSFYTVHSPLDRKAGTNDAAFSLVTPNGLEVELARSSTTREFQRFGRVLASKAIGEYQEEVKRSIINSSSTKESSPADLKVMADEIFTFLRVFYEDTKLADLDEHARAEYERVRSHVEALDTFSLHTVDPRQYVAHPFQSKAVSFDTGDMDDMVDAEKFVLYPISTDYQMRYLMDVFKRISDSDMDFKGKAAFFTGVDGLVKSVHDKEHEADNEEHSWWREDRDRTMDGIRKFYDGVNMITNNPDVRDRIAVAVLGDKPVLLEAYYDFFYLQQMTMTRDFWFRGHLPDKSRYLNKRGYQRSLPSNGFADEFYDALASLDEYHRGFDRNEPTNLTRQNTQSFSYHGENDTTLGLVASPKADRMLGSISTQVKQLSEHMRQTQGATFLLTSGEE